MKPSSDIEISDVTLLIVASLTERWVSVYDAAKDRNSSACRDLAVSSLLTDPC
jgi:hypothetical protein